jgi:hypothetical protein
LTALQKREGRRIRVPVVGSQRSAGHASKEQRGPQPFSPLSSAEAPTRF